jgi:hypothetical protein
LQTAFQARGDHHLVVGADNHALDTGQPFDQRHSRLRAEDEHAFGERVRQHGAVGYQRHATASSRRFTGPQIEDVVVATPVINEEPFVVARRAECSVRQIEHRKAAIGGSARIANAEPPRPIAARPGHVEIAAGLDHEVVQPAVAEHLDRAIHSEPLADPAEVRAHALAFQERRARAFVHLERPVVDERETPADFGRVGNGVVLVVVELPQVRERAEGDVEGAVGPLADLPRDPQDLADIRADGNRMVTRSPVQPFEIAAGPPHAHQCFEPFEFREHLAEARARLRCVPRPRRQAQLGPHRHAGTLDHWGPAPDAGRHAAGAGKNHRQQDRQPSRSLPRCSHGDL